MHLSARMSLNRKYRERIARVLKTGEQNVFLYWKGRVALFALLRAMGVKTGDEVILPAFTCVAVPNAILYLNAIPKYVDIDETVLNPSIEHIEAAITAKTKCIIVQNTFGLSYQVEEIVKIAKKQGIYTIEDCTHGFGGTYLGLPNGSYCDAAFFSTQWNKPYSTGIGGFALVNNETLLPELFAVNQTLQQPAIVKKALLGLLIRSKPWLMNESNYWFLLRLYRRLSAMGFVVGSSSGTELSSIQQPKNYFCAMSEIQMKAGLKGLENLSEQIQLRRKNGEQYQSFLKAMNKWHYPEEVIKNHSFLKYPIFVKNRKAFLKKAEQAKIRLSDWFSSPIHPVQKHFELWGLNWKEFPHGREASAHILNLPTDTTRIREVLDFLAKNAEELI